MQAAVASKLAPTGAQRADAATGRVGASVVVSGRLAISRARPSKAAAVRVLMSMAEVEKKTGARGAGCAHPVQANTMRRRCPGPLSRSSGSAVAHAQFFISLNTHIEPPWFR